MPYSHERFPASVQRLALQRQKFQCGNCGIPITAIGEGGQGEHRFGERAEAHHVIPHKMKGPLTVNNCVIICRSCHLNAHQGGSWRDISIYKDVEGLPIDVAIAKIAALYPHYNG